jgi:hypothetical protein
MCTRPSRDEVYTAKFGSPTACTAGSGSFGSLSGIGPIAIVAIEPKTGACVEEPDSFRLLSRRDPGSRRLLQIKEQLKMKRIRIVGLCLMAVFALSAGAASSASAGELLFEAGTGNIVGGGFLSSGGLSVLQSKGGQTVHCKEVRNHGKFLSRTLGDVLIRFLGCTTAVFGSTTLNCTSTGAGTGEIHLPLATTLFHLGLAHLGTNTSIPAIDILLDEELKFKCGLNSVAVKGDAIGALLVNGSQAPLNTLEKEVTLEYKESAQGVQELQEFLMPGGGLVKQHLTSKILLEEESGETSRDTLDGFTNSAGGTTEIKLVEP